jgi:hypothetical protein
MDMQPAADVVPSAPQENPQAGAFKTCAACIAGALIPGLGHAMLHKWDRAIVFFASISLMLAIGLHLNGDLFFLKINDMFSFLTLKFIGDAGLGLLYWIPWRLGIANPLPAAYTYDYANVFIWVAGLLNMLVIVDVFDIALGRKR